MVLYVLPCNTWFCYYYSFETVKMCQGVHGHAISHHGHFQLLGASHEIMLNLSTRLSGITISIICHCCQGHLPMDVQDFSFSALNWTIPVVFVLRLPLYIVCDWWRFKIRMTLRQCRSCWNSTWGSFGFKKVGTRSAIGNPLVMHDENNDGG